MNSGGGTPYSGNPDELDEEEEYRLFCIQLRQQQLNSASSFSSSRTTSTSRISTVSAPTVEADGDNGIDPDDDPVSVQPHSIDAFRKDAESRKLGSAFQEGERILDQMTHGEYTEVVERQEKKSVDNTLLPPPPDATVDDSQEHLAALVQVGVFNATPSMEQFKSALVNHFCDNASMQFILMPGAHRLNPFGPLEGMALFIMDDMNQGTKKPIPASFLFNPVKYGFGSLAAKLPRPSEVPAVTELYESLLDFSPAKKGTKREHMLDILLEYCKEADMQYAGSSCGFYIGNSGVSPEIWIIVLEGDKSVNDDFQHLLTEGENEKYEWKMTFFDHSDESEDNTNVYRLNKRVAERRYKFADGALKACGLTDGLSKCTLLTDTPHNHMTYSVSDQFFCYFSGCTRLNGTERLLIAKDPVRGFSMYSGDSSESNIVGLGKHLTGSENTWGVMPCVTGKTKLLSEVKVSPSAFDPNPFIVNLEGSRHFARKLADNHRHFDINFQSILFNLGLHALAERTELMPLMAVISDKVDEKMKFVNTLFQDLF